MSGPRPKRRKVGRVCAICGKADGAATWGFQHALKALGVPNYRDDKAHPRCIERLRAKAKREGRQ